MNIQDELQKRLDEHRATFDKSEGIITTNRMAKVLLRAELVRGLEEAVSGQYRPARCATSARVIAALVQLAIFESTIGRE